MTGCVPMKVWEEVVDGPGTEVWMVRTPSVEVWAAACGTLARTSNTGAKSGASMVNGGRDDAVSQQDGN